MENSKHNLEAHIFSFTHWTKGLSIFMDPSDAYYKTKRTLLLFVGALLLAIFAGFKIVNGGQKVSFLPFQLERPELLSTILLVAVLFYIFQHSLQWAAQRTEVQENKFYRIDFIAVMTIGALAVLCYLGSIVLPLVRHLSPSRGSISSVVTLFIVSLIGGALSYLTSKHVEKLSAWLGKYIRGQAALKEESLITALTSENWILNYNPQIPGSKKAVSFKADGSIGEGQNKNETSWRVRNGVLEILNNEGHVFSRFTYNPEKKLFDHTNDFDTLSIKFQQITHPPR